MHLLNRSTLNFLKKPIRKGQSQAKARPKPGQSQAKARPKPGQSQAKAR